jgi:hypothetical protein
VIAREFGIKYWEKVLAKADRDYFKPLATILSPHGGISGFLAWLKSG